MNTLHTLTIALGAASLLACCHRSDSFRLEGTVEGADDMPLTVERSDAHGQWVAIDSTRTNGSCRFSIDIAAAGAADIYRLASGGEYIYFPVDSTETITITTKATSFGTGYTLAGSDNAVALMNFEQDLAKNPADMAAFKRTVYSKYLQPSRGGIVSYYILTRQQGDRPLFDPADPTDSKYFAAVATAFENFRPGDPRTEMLRQITLEGMRRASAAQGKKHVIQAPQVSMFDISLPDAKEQTRRLSDLVGKGRPVVLAFNVMGSEASPAFNADLRKIYDAGRADIYEVGLDADRYAWRQAAQALPWTNVYEADGTRSKALIDYNVSTVPVCFLFNAQGDLVKRAATPSELF